MSVGLRNSAVAGLVHTAESFLQLTKPDMSPRAPPVFEKKAKHVVRFRIASGMVFLGSAIILSNFALA